MFRFYAKRELELFAQSRIRWSSFILFTALALWALTGGLRWQADTQRVLAETPADLFTDREAWFADLKKVEEGGEDSPYTARPINLTELAVHRPDALASLAFRREAMEPHSTLINGWRSEASLFRRYEVQGPSGLHVGNLDLSFIVIVLLPLFIMVLSFDVISTERDSGRYPLFLVQGGSVKTLLLARLALATLPPLLVVVLCVLVASVANGASVSSFLLWSATAGIYALFWSGVAAWIAVRFKHQVTGAMAVLSAWAMLVVLAPSGSQFVAQSLHPLPSRVSFLSEARSAEGKARRNIEERAGIYLAEHPEQGAEPDEAVPGFYRGAYLANIEINESVRPIVQILMSQQSKQRSVVARVAYISPAIVAQEALYAISGTGAERSAAFRYQARAHLRELLKEIGPATVSKSRLSTEEASRIPKFEFKPTRNFGQWLSPLAASVALSGLLFWLALSRAGK